jgi:MHS family proline/betaine transporter-like MFS transporter
MTKGAGFVMAVRVEEQAARKAVTAGAIGNFVEWYDYSVYGFFAPIIASQFFPSEDRVASLLATFAVFAVAFFMRPVGAFVFGHFGDTVGRRNTLAAAIILMGFATLMIGVLPSYAQIGVLAPILLVVARLLQGFSAGGEWSGSAAFMVEYAPENKRGLYGSWQQFSIVAGLLVGSAMGGLLGAVLSESALNAWGWRVPFILGMVVALVGLYLRLRVEDTPAFRVIEEKDEVTDAPVKESFTAHRGESLTAIGFTVAWTVAYYILLTYMPTFVSETLGLPLSQALLSNAIGLVALGALIPFTAVLSDRIGRKPLLIGFSALIALLTYPLFLLASTKVLFLIVVAQVIFGVIISLFSGPGPAALVEMFPTNVRYSALGVSYNLAVAAFGGTAPFIATYLISRTGSNLAPGIYLIVAAVITLIVVSRMKETYREPLREV